ncbi:MAG: Na+/H+ antiporter subunit E [Methanobrevibacter sp.]|jgi:energy-converting hydrogenase B subunit A|nr:Na+/H+ antiporter subunit E [Candidatus Methanovirga aequatorialis]
MFLKRIYYGILFFVLLIYEIVKSTIDTSKRSITGDIDPCVVDIKTVLKRPVSQTILANTITLTPGTLTIDIDSENSILKVAIISPRSNKDVIPLEGYISKMLE